MAGDTDIIVKFIGDTTSIRDNVAKLAGTGKSLKRWALGIGSAIGVAFSTQKVVEFGKASVDAALESEKATARLQNIFKSMGDTTGKAAKEAENYAQVLSKKVGVDDEAIMGAQALLATFRTLSSETGRTSGMFDRATRAVTDLAAVPGLGNMESNAVRLGKALNDPVKGVAALNRVGIQFTEEQKKAIKTSVEHGDVLKAQDIILKEVERQVGGTAAATATGTDHMAVAFDNFKESIGNALLPIINSILPLLAQAFDYVGPIIQSVIGKIQQAAAWLVDWFKKNWPQIRDTAITVFNAIRDAIMPIVHNIVDFVTGSLVPAFDKIWKAIQKAAPDVLDLLKRIGKTAQDVFPKIKSVLEVVVPIVAALVVKLIQLVGWISRNRDVVLALAAPILTIVAAMKLMELYATTVAAATKLWTAAQLALNIVMSLNPIVFIIAGIVALIAIIVLLYNKVDWFKAGVDAAWQFIQKAWDAILAVFQAVFNWIVANWPTLLAVLTGPIGIAVLLITKNWDTIKDAVASVFNWIKNNWPTLLAIITGPIGIATLLITRNWDTIKDAAAALYNWVRDKLQAMVDFFAGIASRIGGYARDIANALKGPINAVIRAWNGLSFKVPAIDAGPIHIGGQDIHLPHVPEIEKGGWITRSGLAMVHRGEAYSGTGNQLGFGGGNTYNISVAVERGVDPAQTGRAIVDLIKSYERANSADWRRPA